MADNNKSMEVQKQEITPTEETERTADVPCFVPRADIYENEDEIIVVWMFLVWMKKRLILPWRRISSPSTPMLNLKSSKDIRH